MKLVKLRDGLLEVEFVTASEDTGEILNQAIYEFLDRFGHVPQQGASVKILDETDVTQIDT